MLITEGALDRWLAQLRWCVSKLNTMNITSPADYFLNHPFHCTAPMVFIYSSYTLSYVPDRISKDSSIKKEDISHKR